MRRGAILRIEIGADHGAAGRSHSPHQTPVALGTIPDRPRRQLGQHVAHQGSNQAWRRRPEVRTVAFGLAARGGRIGKALARPGQRQTGLALALTIARDPLGTGQGMAARTSEHEPKVTVTVTFCRYGSRIAVAPGMMSVA